jgi:hypothetical protein
MPDADLAVALKQAKSKNMFFAFVPKGSDGKLIVSKTKIPPKEIAEAKKEIGGGTPVTGKCFGDGGTMVFQVAKPAAPTLGPALKKVVKRDTGLTIDPEVQLAGDADADGDVEDIEQGAEAAEEQADAAELKAKAAADKARIMERLAGLVGPYKDAVANNGPNAQRLQSLLATVKTCIGKQQFTQVSEGLDMLEELLSQTPTPSLGVDEEDDMPAGEDDVENVDQEAEADADDADEGPAGDDDVDDVDLEADAAELQAVAAADKARIMQRLKALAGPFKEAVADNGPNAKRLQTLFATIKTSIDKEQFTQATEALDKLEELLGEPGMPPPGVLDEDDVPPPAAQENAPAADAAPKEAAGFDLTTWQTARPMVVNGLKALAKKVAATKHRSAVGVLKEINSIIAGLPANPGPNDIDKLEDFIRNDEAIIAADKVPDHFHDLDIRESLLKAWKS